MRIVRLEIFGFKSFMDRLVLPIEGGVTGIVGPNGCGKSNVVDAIRWVLGETKASNLRGDVLEDIIFNGTDKLRPLGLAEVSLTLRAESENFFADLLKSSKDYGFFEADNFDNLSNEKAENALPNVRPQLTVIKGKAQSSETESVDNLVKVEIENSPRENSETPKDSGISMLTRFAWLKSVNEVQVTRRLYRSGESEFFINRVACRLKDIKDLFRVVGLGSRSHTIIAQGEVARIISARPEERRTILEEAAGILGFRDKISASKRRLEETKINISRVEDLVKEVSRQVNSLRVQASRARNREGLKAHIKDLETQVFSLGYKDHQNSLRAVEIELNRIKNEEAELDSKLHTVVASEQQLRNELMSLDVEGDDLRLKIDAHKEELARRASERNLLSSKINELKAYISALQSELVELNERNGLLLQRKQQCERTILELKQQIREIDGQVGANATELENDLAQTASSLAQLRMEISAKAEEVNDIKSAIIADETNLSAVNERIREYSLNNAENESKFQDLLSGCKELSKCFNVPKEYALAVQALLAERAGFFYCDDLSKLVQNLRQLNSATGKNLGFIRRVEQPQISKTRMDLPFAKLRDFISPEPGYEYCLDRLFENVFVVSSLEQALTHLQNETLADGVTLVTWSGEVFSKDSVFVWKQEGGALQLQGRMQSLQERIKESQDCLDRTQKERSELDSKLHSLEEKFKQLQSAHQQAQSKLRELSSVEGNIKGRLGSEEAQLQIIIADSHKVTSRVSEISQRILDHERQQHESAELLQSLVPEKELELKHEVEGLQAEYSGLEKGRQEKRKLLAVSAQEVENVRQDLEKRRERHSELMLDVQKLQLELQHLKERYVLDYGENELEQTLFRLEQVSVISEEELHLVKDEISKLKARMLREGEVDSTSIGRFEEENARLESLSHQRDDLLKACATLEQTIEKLTQTSEHMFIDTFNAVRENFALLIPRLFGGGKASIELLDPNKPLESGIEIIARPPGKKLKSIELLSGGEKALCATALIFAMFLVKPSPLCVLDEVDAPLDDANLKRFLAIVREMSLKTQFLVITHNKATMAIADTLTGVTMEEPGASKVIRVSLQEAYSQVA